MHLLFLLLLLLLLLPHRLLVAAWFFSTLPELPSCKTWVRDPKKCDIPAGVCCCDPYVCNARTGQGNCVYASSVSGGATTLPGSTGGNKPTTLPGNAGSQQKPSTLPAGGKPVTATPLH